MSLLLEDLGPLLEVGALLLGGLLSCFGVNGHRTGFMSSNPGDRWTSACLPIELDGHQSVFSLIGLGGTGSRRSSLIPVAGCVLRIRDLTE